MGSSTRKIVVSGLIVSFMLCGLVTLGVSAEKIVLRYADTPYAKPIMEYQENWIKAFEARYPNIDIRVERIAFSDFQEKYLIQAAAHSLPDLIFLQGPWMSRWIKAGYIMDLMPYVRENEALANLDDYFSLALKLYRYKGGLYGLPMDTGPAGVFYYNVDIFKEAGLEYPKKSWTFEGEFLDAAQKLTKDTTGDGKTDQWGLGSIYSYDSLNTGGVIWDFEGTYLMPFGGRFVNDDETECLITEPGSIKALKFWIGLIHKYHVAPPIEISQGLEGKVFQLEKAGMGYGASWTIPVLSRFREEMGLNYDVMHVPEGPAGRFVGIMGSCFAVTRDSKHPEETWRFLRFYMSDIGLTGWALAGAGSRARRSALTAWENMIDYPKHRGIFREALAEYGVYGKPLGPSAAEAYKVASEVLQIAFLGKISIEEAARKVKQMVDPVLAEYAK